MASRRSPGRQVCGCTAFLLATAGHAFAPSLFRPSCRAVYSAHAQSTCSSRSGASSGSTSLSMAAPTAQEKMTSAVEAQTGIATKLTYLEGNSWMYRLNGMTILVDPIFNTMDFGIPALYKADKKVIGQDYEGQMKRMADVTDLLVITQGLDDHCNAKTLTKLKDLLEKSVRVLAPPSAKPILENIFPEESVTYLSPGDKTIVKAKGVELEVVTTSGALVGPPWQQKENGYTFRQPGEKRGLLYHEPHCMYEDDELEDLEADIVIAPVISQKIFTYTLVDGGQRAIDLAKKLKAHTVVPMANAEMEATGVLNLIVRAGGDLDSFRADCKQLGIAVPFVEAGKPFEV